MSAGRPHGQREGDCVGRDQEDYEVIRKVGRGKYSEVSLPLLLKTQPFSRYGPFLVTAALTYRPQTIFVLIFAPGV